MQLFLPSSAASFKADRQLAGWPEADILAVIGYAIGARYPVGSASRWHHRAGSAAEKRVAEHIAGIVHAAAGDDQLARRTAIAAASYTAALPAAPLMELSAAAIRRAIAEIDGEIAHVSDRVAAIRATRSRAALAEIARQRAAALPDLRRLDREIARLRCDIARGEAGVDGGLGRWAAKWSRRRDLPRLEARFAELRSSLPSYRLSAEKRKRLAELGDRYRQLRAARRALLRASRRRYNRSAVAENGGRLGRKPVPGGLI